MVKQSGVTVTENGWRINKEIPIALIISITGSLFLGGMGYQALKSDIAAVTVAQTEMRQEAKEAKADVRELGKTLSDGTGPLAVSSARLNEMMATQNDLRARVSELERKVLRAEVTQSSRGAK